MDAKASLKPASGIAADRLRPSLAAKLTFSARPACSAATSAGVSVARTRQPFASQVAKGGCRRAAVRGLPVAGVDLVDVETYRVGEGYLVSGADQGVDLGTDMRIAVAARVAEGSARDQRLLPGDPPARYPVDPRSGGAPPPGSHARRLRLPGTRASIAETEPLDGLLPLSKRKRRVWST